MSTIRKFGRLFNVLTVLATVFGMLFRLLERFCQGLRAGLASWTKFGAWFGVLTALSGCLPLCFGDHPGSDRLFLLEADFCAKTRHLPLSATICPYLAWSLASAGVPTSTFSTESSRPLWVADKTE